MHIASLCIYIYVYGEFLCCSYLCMYAYMYSCMPCMRACMHVCLYVCVYEGPNCRAAWNIVAPQHPPWVRLPATATEDTLCKVAMLSIGLEDTLAYKDFVAGFQEDAGFASARRQVARWSIGVKGMLASCTVAAFAAGFFKLLVFQMCVTK